MHIGVATWNMEPGGLIYVAYTVTTKQRGHKMAQDVRHFLVHGS